MLTLPIAHIPWGVMTRYRCSACGNLTRFDVTSTRTTKAFHHFTVGGDLVIEDEEVVDSSIHEVACRWCGHGRSIEVLEEEPPGDARASDSSTAR